MTTWTQIHTDVHISGGDRFSFVLVPIPAHDWMDNKPTDAEKEFVDLCLPNCKPKIINGIEVKITPDNALRMYMAESMGSTFAIGKTTRNNKICYIVGTRSPRDLFKLNLKFPNTENTKTWDSNTLFYVRVAEGDDFADDGSASFGHRRTRSEEGW